MNKGKRSIAIDLSNPAGRELATTLITAPGDDAGIFLSNFPESGWLADTRLRERRPDLVYLNIVGNPDETTAVDYTVNAASGIATATGPVGSLFPVNNALPAWDIATGLNAVIGVLAAERHRRVTGEGQLVKLSLADVAFTMVANLGFLAQAEVMHENRPPLGNDMYGAFGRDFATRDGRRVMVVAISLNQWQTLVRATGIEEHLPADGARLRRRLPQGRRPLPRPRRHRRVAQAVVRGPQPRRGAQGARRARRVLGPVPDVHAAARRRLARASPVNPVFGEIEHPGIGALLTPASPLRFPVDPPLPPAPAPLLGMHTDEVLDRVLGLSPNEIGRLHDDGIVAERGAAQRVSVSEPGTPARSERPMETA